MNHKSKNNQKGFKEKIKGFFHYICSSRSDVPSTNHNSDAKSNKLRKQIHKQSKKERQQKIIKKQQAIRQKFSLNYVLFKVSRKNIVEDQFMSNTILNYQVQKHIAQRIRGKVVTAICSGQFTPQSIRQIPYPVLLTKDRHQLMSQGKQHIKINQFINLNYRPNTIDLLLYQTDQIYSYSSKKINYDTNFHKKQLQTITQLIKISKTSHIIIICSKNITEQQLTDVLNEYTYKYFYELERVRQNQEIFCQILYASNDLSMLNVNAAAFKEFIMEELNIDTQYIWNMKIRQRSYADNKQIQAKMRWKLEKFDQILSSLIELGLSAQIIKVLRLIKKYSEQIQMMKQTKDEYKQKIIKKDYMQDFIIQMSQQSQEAKIIVSKYWSKILHEQYARQTSRTPSLYDPTPQFGIQSKQCLYSSYAEY